MAQNTATFPNIIRSLDKLRILLFWEILKTNQPLLLDANYVEDKKYSEEEKEYIVQTWERLYDSYFQMKNDGKSKAVLEKAYGDMMLLQTINVLIQRNGQFDWIKSHLDILPETTITEMKQTVVSGILSAAEKLKINPFDDIDVIQERLVKYISGLDNKYKIGKVKTDKQVNEQIENIYSVVVRVSNIVEKRLDVESMVVSEWLEWERLANEKIKAAEEAKRKRKK